jgi:DNA-binding response OmpR family regulator
VIIQEDTPIANKILIIEDDPSFLRGLTFILEKEGYAVIIANNGLIGLRKAREEKPNLVILDVMLPGLDGFEVCHRLRADPDTEKIPVIMLSAKGQDSDKTTGLKVGANEFLSKPVDRIVLLGKISEFIDSPKP